MCHDWAFRSIEKKENRNAPSQNRVIFRMKCHFRSIDACQWRVAILSPFQSTKVVSLLSSLFYFEDIRRSAECRQTYRNTPQFRCVHSFQLFRKANCSSANTTQHTIRSNKIAQRKNIIINMQRVNRTVAASCCSSQLKTEKLFVAVAATRRCWRGKYVAIYEQYF